MYKLKIVLASVLLMVTTQSLKAQEVEPEEGLKPAIPASILRIGYSPINTAQSGSFKPGISIDWEKPLSAHFTFGANLYRDLSGSSIFGYDQLSATNSFPRGQQYNDIRTSLSFSLTYYFKAYAYDGFYLSFRTNNALAEVKRYERDAAFNTFESRRLISEPRRGLYLGYRKTFDNGFFIDGSAGFAPGNNDQFNRRMHNDWLDFRLTLGWQLGSKKKKKLKKR